ncbi:hypothetical protein L5515_019491 [Caenorhabditis briggsae]|uniref:Uncharacterized protein n=2 Tax=Caenorhabditis briggsae TaxID=6238 RepID=A0AAE9FM29_CAEBR|nr:hypothetical protein L5515_019491 [Caenorhabditis briggsae]
MNRMGNTEEKPDDQKPDEKGDPEELCSANRPDADYSWKLPHIDLSQMNDPFNLRPATNSVLPLKVYGPPPVPEGFEEQLKSSGGHFGALFAPIPGFNYDVKPTKPPTPPLPPPAAPTVVDTVHPIHMDSPPYPYIPRPRYPTHQMHPPPHQMSPQFGEYYVPAYYFPHTTHFRERAWRGPPHPDPPMVRPPTNPEAGMFVPGGPGPSGPYYPRHQ